MRILPVLISSHILFYVFHESQIDPYLHDGGGKETEQKENRLAKVFLEDLLLSSGFSISIWGIFTGLQRDGFSRKVKEERCHPRDGFPRVANP